MKINKTLLILDTETGGTDPNIHSLMEIACIVLKNNKIVKKYTSLLKSNNGKYVCNDFARKMHGITDEELNMFGKFPIDIIKDLKEIQKTYFNNEPMTIVAHNASFDIPFVKKMFSENVGTLTSTVNNNELDYNNMFSRNVIDTATMALILRLQNKLPFDRCSLDNILTFYNIKQKVNLRHTALFDATQTAKAFILMFKDLSSNNVKIKESNKKYESDFDDSKKL